MEFAIDMGMSPNRPKKKLIQNVGAVDGNRAATCGLTGAPTTGAGCPPGYCPATGAATNAS